MSENIENNAENAENTENVQDANVETAANTNAENAPLTEEETINKMLEEIADWKDKNLRMQAEFENFKRRTAKERMDLLLTAGKDVLVNMLEVMDDMDRAEDQMNKSEDVNAVKEGVQLVFGKFRKIMETKGIKALESKGMAFDVEMHEAITEIPAPNAKQVGKVIDEVQKGYYLNEKLVRFAKVVIGK
jgi:molecular chaperone GrpE